MSEHDILRAWEACASASPAERPLALLVTAGGDAEELAALPLGERDARLLDLRARTFGSTLDAVVECPRCLEPLEFSADIGALAPPLPPPARRHRLALADGEVEFRLLDTRDLAAASAEPDPAAFLLERSLVAPARPLDEAERELLADRLSEIDPRADLLLALTCPACAHAWSAPLDAAGFVLAEVTAAARRLLREVAALAAAFGWTEPDVLALSPARRQAYLEIAELRASGVEPA